MNDLHEKIQNIKLLKELFATQFIHLSENLSENKKLLKNKKISNYLEQVKLSLDIILENICYIKKLLNELNIDISTEEKVRKTGKNKNSFFNILVNLQLLTNIFASEFVYLTKKLEADLKNNKKIPQKLYNEFKKVDYDIEIITKFIGDLSKILDINNNINENQKNQKKKHEGFINTTIFIKKKFLYAEKIKYLNKNIKIKKRAPFSHLDPVNFPELKKNRYLKKKLIEEYKTLIYFRNETFNFWQPVVNEVLYYITQKFFTLISNKNDDIKKFQNEMKQILSKSLLEGIDLLTYPQKHTLFNRLKTYANNYLNEILQNDEIYFSELQNKILKKDEENNREDINFLPDIDENIVFKEKIITPEQAVIEKDNIYVSEEFWKKVKIKADELNLIDEYDFLNNFLLSKNKTKLNGIFDFKKDYYKRKIKGSLELLVNFVKSEIIFKKEII